MRKRKESRMIAGGADFEGKMGCSSVLLNL